MQINKHAKLAELWSQILAILGPESKFVVGEVVNNKVYRVYDDSNMQIESIYKRTNELFCYEQININQDREKLAAKRPANAGKKKAFASYSDIVPGTILDAQDQYGKWYVALCTAREFDFEKNRTKIKVHYYEFNDRWDEWFYEQPDRPNRLAPYAAYSLDPPDKMFGVQMLHRRVIHNEESNQSERQVIGMPYFFTMGDYLSWKTLYNELVL